jgi:hypothetical protein
MSTSNEREEQFQEINSLTAEKPAHTPPEWNAPIETVAPLADWLHENMLYDHTDSRTGKGRDCFRCFGFAEKILNHLKYAQLRAALEAAHQEHLDMAALLEIWARESVDGGWSTHQVDAMRRCADRCRKFAASAWAALRPAPEVPRDKS